MRQCSITFCTRHVPTVLPSLLWLFTPHMLIFLEALFVNMVTTSYTHSDWVKCFHPPRRSDHTMHEVSFCAITQTRHCILQGGGMGVIRSSKTFCYWWLPVIISGYPWLLMAISGYLWSGMVEAAYPWLLMAISGMVQRRHIHGY